MLLVSALWLATNRRWAGPGQVPGPAASCAPPQNRPGRIWGRRHCPAPLLCVTLTNVSETARCPHCGAAVPNGGALGGAAHPGTGERGLGSLYREIRRIREIAEARDAGEGGRRVAELTREVEELRATVARLRGTTTGAAVRA